MYIVHVVSSLTTGGAEKLVADISSILKRDGNKVKVISILKARGIPYEILKNNNIDLVELNYTNKFDFRIAYDIYNETKECDIVHTHTFYAQFYAAILVRRDKLVTTEHNTHNNRRNKKVFKIMDYFMYKKYKKIICISMATKENLNKWLKSTKEKTRVINNGIDINIYKNSKEVDRSFFGGDNKVVLSCVASLTEQKNHSVLIDAMRNVNENIHLFLFGDGILRADLTEKVKMLNLENRIHFYGNHMDIPGILKGSDMFIIASKWEGFGLAAIEAVAADLPTIISDVPGLGDLFEEDQVVKVNPNSSKDIAEKINYVSQNIDKIRSKKINIDKYSIEEMTKKYLDVYIAMMKDNMK